MAFSLASLGAIPALVPQAFAQDAAPASPAAKRMPIAEIGTIPNTSQVRISPSGNRLAMTLTRDGQEIYAVLDLDKPNPRPKVFASSGELTEAGDRTVGFYRWVGDDHIVFQLISREMFFGQRGDVARLVSFDVDSGKMEPLAWRDAGGNASRILHVDHDRGKILLERTNRSYEVGADQRRPEVVEVDVSSGKYDRVQRPSAMADSWYADGSGAIRGAVSYDSDSGTERLIYRSDGSGGFKTIQRNKDENFSGVGIRPSIFLAEPDMAIATSNHDGFTRVYRVNLQTMELVEELFRVEGYDIEGTVSNAADDTLMGVTYVTDRPRTTYFDPVMKAVQEQVLDESFGEGNARIVSASDDNTKLVIEIAKTNQAGGYFFYDTQSGDFRQIGWANNVLKDVELNPVSMVRYKASDGETIEAAVTIPRHRQGQKNLPVVMITHGGPFGPRDNAQFDAWAQAIAELGYVVVQPNYRGSGGYGSEWIKKGRDDGFGLRMQDDLNDAITYLAGQGMVDADRACMMGWSYGGYASARAAQRDPEKWDCAVAGAGVYDLSLMRSYDVSYLGKFGSNYLSKGAADLDTVSPAKNTRGEWAPILIVHGVRDARVPVDQAQTLVRNLKSAGKVEGKDFVYLEQPKNTHNHPYDSARIEWLGAAAAWIEKHNPAYVPSDPDYATRPSLDAAAIDMANRLKIGIQ